MNAPNNADWLRQFVTKADPDTFTAAFSDGASTILRKAGLPATVEELRAIEEIREGERLTSRTAADRIENDRDLPEQVRLAPDAIYRAAQVRHWIKKNNARNVATETARLFGVVFRSIDIDAAPYIRAGKRTLAARSKGTASGRQKAGDKAKLIRPIWSEVVTSYPKEKHPERCERVGNLARERHPRVFATPPSASTISRAVRKTQGGK